MNGFPTYLRDGLRVYRFQSASKYVCVFLFENTASISVSDHGDTLKDGYKWEIVKEDIFTEAIFNAQIIIHADFPPSEKLIAKMERVEV